MSGSIDRPFDLTWADNLRAACGDVGTPYFLKQLGAHVVAGGQRIKFQDRHGGDWDQWPRRLRVRQMPIYVGRSASSRLRQVGALPLQLAAHVASAAGSPRLVKR